MNIKRVFVTGGAGVIGRQLIPILEQAGHEIYVGDLLPRPSEFSKKIHYLQGDLNHLSVVDFVQLRIDIVIHLAATFERTEESLEFWEDNFHNNVSLNHHIITLCKAADSVKRFLFASSYLVYDSQQYLLPNSDEPFSLSSESRIAPRNLIGASKLYHEAELLYMSKFEEIEFEIVILRIFRGYGIGSRDVISRWVRDAIQGQKIRVFNESGKFDYIYSKDSAKGVYKLAMESHYQGVINFGTGLARSISDVIGILRNHFTSLVVESMENFYPVEASQADIKNLLSTLAWTPEYTLEHGISEIIDYELKRFNESKKIEK